ncbi:MAG: chromate efflux transporter [Flavobacteriales bacterium]|nr:chromate efflux transporter [Flavobacteriales bacterium]
MKGKLREVAGVFLKMGIFAFGGPAAHIAMMEREIIEKRKWMSHEHFLDLIGATNLIPGPNSTEMTMHCGHEYAGRSGLFVAGISFITPAILITGTLAWLYVSYGSLPEVAPFLVGIKPAILAIIAQAVLKLGKKAFKKTVHYIIGALVLAACLLGLNEVTAILGAGFVGMLIYLARNKGNLNTMAWLPWILGSSTIGFINDKSLQVFLIFLKVGSILYGSGYVLFAYLDAELVDRGLLTYGELMDAIAVGQMTPGPVLSTATFIGYQLNEWSGALAATAGIFLPSFLFVLLLNPVIPKLRKSQLFAAALDMVNVAAMSVMAAVLLQMTWETCTSWQNILVAAVSFLLVFKFSKISTPWIVVQGALLGYVLQLI